MYRCDCCSEDFEDTIYQEVSDSGEKAYVSPCCGEDYTEVEACTDCGDYYETCELNDGYCEDCVDCNSVEEDKDDGDIDDANLEEEDEDCD